MKKYKNIILVALILIGFVEISDAQTCWQKVSQVKDRYLRVVKVSNSLFLAAAGNTSGVGPASINSLYISNDLKTWNVVNISLPSPAGLAFNIDNNGILYLATQHSGVYSSSDSGKTWNYANVGNCYGCMALDFESDSLNNLYVGTGGSGRGLNLSINNGASWTNKIGGRDFTDIEVVAKGVNQIYASNGNNGIYMSSDNGNTWQQILNQPFSNNTIMIKQLNSSIYVFSNNGNIYKSINSGLSWVLHSNIPISGTAVPYHNDAVFMDNSIWWVGTYQNGIWRSDDNGITWSRKDSCLTGSFHYLFKQGPTLLATTSEGIFKFEECNLIFLNQTKNQSSSINSQAQFTALASDSTASYQWQSNQSNLGWVNIPSSSFYSGVTSKKLTVNNIKLKNHEQLFRVIASKNTCKDTSVVAMLTVNDTCITSTTDTLYIKVNTSSLSNPVYNTVKVYPNPSSTQVIIDNGNYSTMGSYTAKIVNSIGQQVFQSVINQQQFVIDARTMGGAGVYTLYITDANNKVVGVKKIVLQ